MVQVPYKCYHPKITPQDRPLVGPKRLVVDAGATVTRQFRGRQRQRRRNEKCCRENHVDFLGLSEKMHCMVDIYIYIYTT